MGDEQGLCEEIAFSLMPRAPLTLRGGTGHDVIDSKFAAVNEQLVVDAGSAPSRTCAASSCAYSTDTSR